MRLETELNRFSGFHAAKPLKRFSDQALLTTQLKLGVNENLDRLQESEMRRVSILAATFNSTWF